MSGMQYNNTHDRILSLICNVLDSKRPPAIVETINVSSDSEVDNKHEVQQPTSLNYCQAVEEIVPFKNIKRKKLRTNFDEDKSKVLRGFNHEYKWLKIVFGPIKEWGADFALNNNCIDYSDDLGCLKMLQFF